MMFGPKVTYIYLPSYVKNDFRQQIRVINNIMCGASIGNLQEIISQHDLVN